MPVVKIKVPEQDPFFISFDDPFTKDEVTIDTMDSSIRLSGIQLQALIEFMNDGETDLATVVSFISKEDGPNSSLASQPTNNEPESSKPEARKPDQNDYPRTICILPDDREIRLKDWREFLGSWFRKKKPDKSLWTYPDIPDDRNHNH